MRKITILLFACFFANISFAQEKSKSKFAYTGFSGGMLLHTGYVRSGEFQLLNTDGTAAKTLTLSGMPFGIGGQARVHFGEHFRVGGEGYVSEYSYANKSYASIGWGGILADCSWIVGRFVPFVGGTFGGGSMKNVSILNPPTDGYEGFTLENNTSFRKFGFLCLVPFVGTEFAMTKKIHLVLKVDYIFNVSNPQPDFVTGPRFYFGFSFCR
ncbi:MAG: hypothetical protein LBN95_09320 [Prevotellaceae bacterium]|jgi:hypothetical protein|nr:hypothetical protein [Prevotellaceae bacterium]